MMSNTWKDIGTLLLEYGLIVEKDLSEGVKLQKETGLRLGEALVQLGKVSMEDIDWVLSKQLDIPSSLRIFPLIMNCLTNSRRNFSSRTRYCRSMKQMTRYQLSQRTLSINLQSVSSRNRSANR